MMAIQFLPVLGLLGSALKSKLFWSAIGGGGLVIAAWAWVEHREDAAFERGVNSKLITIEKLKREHSGEILLKEAEIASLKLELKVIQDQRAKEVQEFKDRQDELKKGYDKTLVGIQERLRKAEAEKVAAIKARNTEVARYVPKAVDAKFPLPLGFVQYVDSAATGTPGTPLAGSGTVDVGTTSAVTASRAAAIIRENYEECRERDRLLSEWRDWYVQNKAYYEQASRPKAFAPQ